MKPIIEVTNLSKKFRYGESQPYYTFRETLASLIKYPNPFLSSGRKHNVLDKDEFWALKDVSFTIKRGQAMGFIGPNGAGKSTLLKVLSQITPPTSGQAILRGRVGSLLEVGTGFQQELTGRENIYLNGAILGMSRREISRKFEEIVDFSGIDKFLDTPVKRYSSGMYMRLAFAVAANLESEILIVDEVLAVGDAEFQKKCLGKMGEITKKEGRTVLFVSHNLEAVRNLCDRCLLLNRGKNIFEGDVKQTLEKYNSLHDNDLKNYISGRSINHRGSGTLRFTNIQVMDTKEKIRNTFMIGETVRFEVSYEVLEKMVGLNITIGLFSSKTENVLLADVAHDIKKGVVKKGLCGNVIIDIKLNSIRPGEYILYFRITDTAATKQSHPINYEIIKGIIKPLVVESKKRENVNLVGSFTLPSKVVYK